MQRPPSTVSANKEYFILGHSCSCEGVQWSELTNAGLSIWLCGVIEGINYWENFITNSWFKNSGINIATKEYKSVIPYTKIHTVLSVRSLFYAVRCLSKNPGNTSEEICERQQGRKSAKSSFPHLLPRGPNTAGILLTSKAGSGL